MMYAIKNIDDNITYYFSATTAYEAMKKMLYYLSLNNGKAKEAQINKTESNRFLYTEVNGKTYSVKM